MGGFSSNANADNGATAMYGTGNSIVSEQVENFDLGMGSLFISEGAGYSTTSNSEQNDNSVFSDNSDNSVFSDNSDNSVFSDYSDNSVFSDNSDNSVFFENSGLNLSDGAQNNSGVQLGENAAYTVNTVAMDDNTAALVSDALGLMYSNTRNTLEAQAANNTGTAAALSDPVVISTETEKAETATNKRAFWWAGFALAAYAIYQFSKGRKK